MKNKGILLAKALRHDPIGVLGIHADMDYFGFVSVPLILEKLHLSMDELQGIHDTNNKKRFEFNHDKSRIRALQGHTIEVNLNLTTFTPPDVLYHRTYEKYISPISLEGIQSMDRHHVHMSESESYSKIRNVVLIIDSKKMAEDGFIFYKTKNDVWLTDYVPPSYIIDVKKD